MTPHEPSDPNSPPDETAPRFHIVALGASAGGLLALEEFFTNMPADSGMAFVVVTHQDPDRTSLLAELLGRKTSMPVAQIEAATRIEPNHVYTSPPGYELAVLRGVLHPMEPRQSLRHAPIDALFRSLARDQKEHAVAIVLSGTGSDGSVGLQEIKAELGLVMVQQEQSAQYSGMPHRAIATELVDYVLPATQMPAQLLAYTHNPGSSSERQPTPESLQQIFVLIAERTGHDFSSYKGSTIGRRIERRMNLHHLDSTKRYARYLQANPREVDLLFKELLIGVTSLFRDPEAWSALSSAVAAQLDAEPDEHVFRAWVAGCSTGEEAYSLAIVTRELMEARGQTRGVQIFATDLDPKAIEVARAGVYPAGIANDVSPQRLVRFFSQHEQSYRVRKEIRELIVFAQQSIIADPPFTKLDLLSCRNVLIYLDTALQRRLLPIFHYALRPGGLLMLGPSESTGTHIELFAPVDKRWKVFRRRETATPYVANFPATASVLDGSRVPPHPTAAPSGLRPSLDQTVDRMLLRELVPPTVIVHERGDVVHVHGKTGRFLEPAQGAQSTANIFNMAREGLQIALSSGLRQASTRDDEVIERGVSVRTNGDTMTVDVRVMRMTEPESLRGLFRVTFDPVAIVTEAEVPRVEAASDRVADLERELLYSRRVHQGTIEELETANEELKSTNEELQSTNEELQSANEELETSKEEMQSLNEELQTVNTELQHKVDELSDANNDMKNLLNGTSIATVFLDDQLRIKRFTDQARSVIPLIASDVGRPMGDLVSSLRYDHLVDDAQEVIRTLVVKETEVHGERGEVYLMRILPYRTTDNVIEGVVLTFVDVTRVKEIEREQSRLLAALRASPVGVFGQDLQLRVTWAESAVFGRTPAQLVGMTDAQLFEPADVESLARLKRPVLQGEGPQHQRIELSIDGQRRAYDLYIEPQRDGSRAIVGLSCVAMDVTPPDRTTS